MKAFAMSRNSPTSTPTPAPALLLGALMLALVCASPASAQDDAARAGREREALRRSQSALKLSQQQEATLTGEKAALTAQTGKLGETLKRTEAQLAGGRAEAVSQRAELARVSTELEALRRVAEADKVADLARSAASAQRDASAQRLITEGTRTVASLTTLLGNAVQANTKAELANREMHAFGLQMIEQVRGRTSVAAFEQSDPVLGFGQVKLENTAEGLRDRFDALRVTAKVQ